MQWTLSETIALASEHCLHCQGFGMYRGAQGDDRPCECVLKEIFRACHARFQACVIARRQISPVPLEWHTFAIAKPPDLNREAEFMADFCLISSRVLDPKEHQIFRCHFLLGAGWETCCRSFRFDRATFYRHVGRIEQKLGRAFRELEPYGLFPLDHYFEGTAPRRRDPRIEALLRAVRMPRRAHSVLRRIA